MKLLYTADLHLGLSRFPGRLEEADAVLSRFRDLAHDEKVDMVALIGDSFDSRYPKPPELALFARFLRDLSALEVPVLVLPGNHDGPSQIAAHGSHTLSWVAAARFPNVHVLTAPGVSAFDSAVVAHLPYAHRRAYDVAASGLSLQDRHERASKALVDSATQLVEDAAEQGTKRGVARLFMWHGTVVGSRIGSERALRLEDELEIGSHVLAPLDFSALGHIHLPQAVGNGEYAGAPMAVDFGEAGQMKRFVIARVDPGVANATSTYPSGARPIVLADTDGGPEVDVEGALVRVTLGFPASRAELLLIEEAYYAEGASYVQASAAPAVVARTPAERALAVGTSPEDAIRAYLRLHELPDEPFISAARDLISSAS